MLKPRLPGLRLATLLNADNICKQLAQDLFDTLVVFLKYILKKLILKKNNRRRQNIKVRSMLTSVKVTLAFR